MEELPQEGWAIVGVIGQELVEERGTGPAQSRDHDRGMDGFVGDGRLLAPQIDEAQPVLQDDLQFAPGAEAAGQMESGLVVQRATEAVEGLLPPGVTEVVEPGGLLGRLAEQVGLEGDEGATVVADALAQGDELLGPRAARRRGPGHETQP